MVKKFEFRKSDPKKNWQDFSLRFFVPRSPEMLQVNQNTNQTSSPGSLRKIARQSAILEPKLAKNHLGQLWTRHDDNRPRLREGPINHNHSSLKNETELSYLRWNELFYTEPPFASQPWGAKAVFFWRISRQIWRTFDSDGRFLTNFRGKLRRKREK